MSLSDFSREIIELIERGKISSRQELNRHKSKLAKKHSLNSIPSNPDILSSLEQVPQKAHKLLCKKPVKSLSGIVVVAAMVPPHNCPGECIYCPSSLVEENTPQSYTGREPATMRALQSNFHAGKQIKQRLNQLRESGHPVSKVEFIVMGGTFFSQSKDFQKKFMLQALNAFTSQNTDSIEKAKQKAEKSLVRITGITFETRPDYCSRENVNRMLWFGGTRCELGVQILNNRVYETVKRGHSIKAVSKATRDLKDAGFKVLYHLMPGLPSASLEDDLNSFKKMLYSEEFKPDMLKIYPCLVVRGTKLYEKFKNGEFKPMQTEKAVELISKLKELVPPWMRIMRIQRDIPSPLIEGGVKKSNLRQLVKKAMDKRGKKCNCIRCREAALKKYKDNIELNLNKAKMFVGQYRASNGLEFFLSLENKERETLFGFCRMRIPDSSYREEIDSKAAVLRELRVFGKPLALGERKKSALQHHGLGEKLFNKAEEIASESFDKKRLFVIAGLGVREYYKKKFECKKVGPYMAKTL